MATLGPNPAVLATILAQLGATPEQLEQLHQVKGDGLVREDVDDSDAHAQPGGARHDRAAPPRRMRQVPAHVYQAARLAKPVAKQRMDEAVRWVRETGIISRPLSCTLSSLVGFLPWKQAAAGEFLVFPSNATLAGTLNLLP